MAVFPVIMCGGSGTRLWPASRAAKPKQFIPLAGERSTFQETVLRIRDLKDAARIVVVAGVAHGEVIASQLAEIGVKADILLEPEPRDSAPAMAAACAFIAARDPQGVAVVVSADHHVPDARAFRSAVELAAESARDGLIVTLGVAPREPSTAYGYIAPGEALGAVSKVKAFVEKPDAVTAQRYIAEGYLWNSGNFVVRAATLLEELERLAPDVARAACAGVAEAHANGSLILGEAFRAAPKISIDYAVMEKTDRAAVLRAGFAWSDLGAWDAVWAASLKDMQGNAARGEAVFVEARNCLARAPEGLQIEVVGARDIAVIAEGEHVLVCDMASSQSVKTLVDRLRAERRETLAPRSPFKDVAGAAGWFDHWIKTNALPLWWSLGADHEHGGFREALTLSGEPVSAPRRARVQTRQAFVFATAGMMGWVGPWRQAAWHGMDYFLERYRRPDGLFRTLVSAGGEPLDETAALYDQAFALLAMATLKRADPEGRDLAGEAEALRKALEALRHPAGGFRETGARPFQANAHMHLLEASLAWIEAGGGREWETLAAEIVELALDRFIDRKAGFIREAFNEDWTPAGGDEGRFIEPGHQFEWAWLLERCGRLGVPRAAAAARRLLAAGLRGVDPDLGVAVNALWDDFSVRDPNARLWPQTEYLKATLLLGAGEMHVVAAAQALHRYLDTPALGAWYDTLTADGAFTQESAPASSLYHIVAAWAQLQRQ
ncbi:AGE family epimerase/isomerase [Phenylobacterium sp.]|uniref:AGE family epimerase/isomerase n=1 Tax=Phenylobacterium sp. TaxID=1871053 RepID=UPI0035AD870F